MNNPALYRKMNLQLRMDRVKLLNEFEPKIRWRPDGKDSLLDIGCAGGDITAELIQPIMPKTFQRLVGVDINKNMIDYANKQFGNSQISFAKLDIGGNISTFLDKNEPFDHITCLNCLHLVPDLKLAIENIFNLLRQNGDCLLYTISESFVFDVYKKMFNQWSEYMEDADDYVPCFYQRINPVYMLKKLLTNAGFPECIVEQRKKAMTFDDIKTFEDGCKSLVPLYSRIPAEKQEEFMQQFIHHAMEFTSKDNKIYISAEHLVAYASK